MAILALTAVGQSGRGIPAPGDPAGLGVNIHFTDPRPGEMEMIAAAGFRWVRMDFGWDQTEVAPGQYDFSAYDRLMAALRPHHIRPIFILDYSSQLYDAGQSPHTEEGRQAFARWAASAAVHFRDRGILWEMYNEPNIGFWRPTPNVDQYIQLALATGKALRRAAPRETYIGPATSGLDFSFLEACFKAGLLDYWSAVSVHPYRQNDPETAAADFRRLRALIAQYAPTGKRIPVISGEWGYSSAWSGMTEERQGKLLPRELLTNLSNGIPVSIWYDWHDDGTNPKDPEHHFGTVHNPYSAGRTPVYDPKPAYRAMQALHRSLDGYTFNKRLDVGSDQDYVLLFSRGSEVRLAGWTTSRTPHSVTIPASPGSFHRAGTTGDSLADVTAGTDGLALDLTDAPQYLWTDAANVLLRAAQELTGLPLETVIDGAHSPQLSLDLSNPLAQAATVDVILGSAKSSANLKSGESTQVLIPLPETRPAEPLPLKLVLSTAGSPSIVLRSLVMVSDPLKLTVLPPGDQQLPIRVENPSGEPFSGTVKVWLADTASGDPVSQPVSFRSGEREQIVRIPYLPPPRECRVRAQLLDDRGAIGTEIPEVTLVPVQLAPSAAAAVEWAAVADGDPAVPSEQGVTSVPPPRGLPVSYHRAVKLTYDFHPGWKFVRLVRHDASAQSIRGKPRQFGVWVYGDGQGNQARLRFVDSSGQTFQPGGMAIDWSGWRYVTFPMDGSDAGHWGGADDGVVHYPIRWDSILLLDSARRAHTSGAIFLAQPTLIY